MGPSNFHPTRIRSVRLPRLSKPFSTPWGKSIATPDGASTALRRGIADLWETAPSNLIIANGSDEVFTLLTAAWLSPGENAVSTRQTFSQYRYSVALFGGEMREVDLDRGKYDLEAMAALVNDKTRLVFICNPNNPTGTYLGHEELSSFLDGLPEGVIAVLDEAYADFAEAKDFPDSKALLKEHENLVVVRTFSKLYGLAGLRVGYGVGSSRITSGAERASMPFNVNNLAQAAARAALDDEEHRRLTLNLVHSERAFLADEFTQTRVLLLPV